MNKKIIFIIILFLSLIIVGCGKKEIDYEKHLIDFSYEYGNKKDGFYSYNIYLNKSIVQYVVSGNSIHIEKEIDKEYLDKIDKIIEKYNVLDWDGFNKQKNGGSDEIAFSIQIGYDTGKNYSASGYMKYPENFNEVHKELLRIFDELNN